jgi:hypothetical protein
MKFFINRKPVDGPWGGGNKFLTALIDIMKMNNHDVVFDLNSDDIDIIFCMDPRPNDNGIHYQHMLDYKNTNKIKILQRVGDLGTHGKPELFSIVKKTVETSDWIIFPSEWAKNFLGFSGNNFSIIKNKPKKIFHNFKSIKKIEKPIKIVTHHWSNNPKKGFEIYRYIDENIKNDSDLEFSYIGRLPANLEFKRIKHIPPLVDTDIAKQLQNNHIYVTASQEEAGANHVLEAMACNLPILYDVNGGSINEYVSSAGIAFDGKINFFEKLKELIENYQDFKKSLENYTDTVDQTVQEYYKLICKAR